MSAEKHIIVDEAIKAKWDSLYMEYCRVIVKNKIPMKQFMNEVVGYVENGIKQGKKPN